MTAKDRLQALRKSAATPADPNERVEPLGISDFVAPTALAGGTALSIAGSKGLDRRLTQAGLASKMPGAKWRDVLAFLKSTPAGSMQSVEHYADISSKFLNREIAQGVNGLKLLKVMGNALYRAGKDVGGISPKLKFLERALKSQGAKFRADYAHPHFNGFGTAGQGVRTLIQEKANWGGLSLENMGHIARKALHQNGWQANPRAARMFDREFRKLMREGYHYRPLPNKSKEIVSLLEEIARTNAPGTDAQTIARSLKPGADITKSLYEAVKSDFSNSPNSFSEVTRIGRTPAGRLALMAASGTSRLGAVQHGVELTGLNLLKALRSGKFRGGAGVAGAVGTAALLYNLFKRGKRS